MIHRWQYLGYHRELALLSPATPSSAALSLFGECFCCQRLHSGSWDLGWSFPPRRVGCFPPSSGPRFTEIWPRGAASFTTTASPILTQDDLVGPCDQRKFTSWREGLVIP